MRHSTTDDKLHTPLLAELTEQKHASNRQASERCNEGRKKRTKSIIDMNLVAHLCEDAVDLSTSLSESRQ